MAMRIEPLLVLVSGDAQQGGNRVDVPPLAFATRTGDLGFTSCSGLLLKATDAPAEVKGLVLMPASALRPWLQPGNTWDCSFEDVSPPPLAPGVAVCAVGSVSALHDGAALCIPFATLHLQAAARTATNLLHNLNRNVNFSPYSAPWAFQWSVGGPGGTAAELASLVLCWVQTPSTAAPATPALARVPGPPPPPPATAGPPRDAGPASGPASWVAPLAPGEVQQGGSGLTAAAAPPSTLASGGSGGDPPVDALRAFHAALVAESVEDGAPRCAPSGCANLHGRTNLYGSYCADPGLVNALQGHGSPGPCTLTGGSIRSGGGRGSSGSSNDLRPGSPVAVVGSPFGCLAPFHFLNTQVNGAIACAFPSAPPPPAAATAPLAVAGTPQRASNHPASMEGNCGGCYGGNGGGDDDGDCLGPALFALDAHLFPGMEGALVAPLATAPWLGTASSAPRHSTGCPTDMRTDDAAGGGCTGASAGAGCRAARGHSASRNAAAAAGAAAAAEAGPVSGVSIVDRRGTHGTAAAAAASASACAAAATVTRPLGLLCTPLCRRVDGVQVPLAVAWPHVRAALLGLLERLLLLRRDREAVATGCLGAGRPSDARGDGKGTAGAQQLELQPVSQRSEAGGVRPCVSGACGASGRSGEGGGACVFGSCGNTGALPPFVRRHEIPTACALGDPWTVDGPPPSPPPLSIDSCAGPVQQQGELHAHDGADAATAATAAAAVAAPGGSLATSSAQGPPPVGLPPWVLQSVVLLRCNGSWATGLLLEAGSGLLITTAHLFPKQQGVGAGAGRVGGDGGVGSGGPLPAGSVRGRAPHGTNPAADSAVGGAGGSGSSRSWEAVVCWARVPQDGGARGAPACAGYDGGRGCRGLPYRWLRAHVVYVWANHLDLAVLRLAREGRGPAALAAVKATARARDEGEDPWVGAITGLAAASRHAAVQSVGAEGGRVSGSAERPGGPAIGEDPGAADGRGVRVLGGGLGGRGAARQRQDGLYGTGTPVWAVGHSLVGPSAGWPPLVSYGCVARVLRRRCGRPTMLVATTTTHAGGSGGALVDSAGRLVGLVTSNARHAGGVTLPNMAFCIAAEELEPVLRWAAAQGRVADSEGESGGATDPSPGSRSSSGSSSSGPYTAPEGTAHSNGGTAHSCEEALGGKVLGGQSTPQPLPSLDDLAALDVEDAGAARIWRLQMPAPASHSGVLGALAAGAAAAAAGAAAAEAEPGQSDRPVAHSRL